MDISRRDFMRVSAASGGAAALGGLVGLGADLAPTLAAAAELRSKDAKTHPSICRYCSVGYAKLVRTVAGTSSRIEADPANPSSDGRPVPKHSAIQQHDAHPNR